MCVILPSQEEISFRRLRGWCECIQEKEKKRKKNPDENVVRWFRLLQPQLTGVEAAAEAGRWGEEVGGGVFLKLG